jgi:hypothetical protein
MPLWILSVFLLTVVFRWVGGQFTYHVSPDHFVGQTLYHMSYKGKLWQRDHQTVVCPGHELVAAVAVAAAAAVVVVGVAAFAAFAAFADALETAAADVATAAAVSADVAAEAVAAVAAAKHCCKQHSWQEGAAAASAVSH